MSILALFVALIFLYSLVSQRMARTIITPPILFTTAGMLTCLAFPAVRQPTPDFPIFLRVAEVGLVLLLFTEASHTDLRMLRAIKSLPARLLGIGMPLTLLLGAFAALVVFHGFSLWEAGILAAILAPTDAGLGQIIVSSPRVPMRIRRALNVEAGLNDGLAVPFLLFFMARQQSVPGSRAASLMHFIWEQLGLGTLIGVAIGLAGGALLGLARRRALIAEPMLRRGVVALALLCMFASHAAGASMFITAFVAGLAVQVGFKEAGRHSNEFTEEWGQLLNLSIFFLFGMLVGREWRTFEAPHIVYAVLSLTVIRMLPVALSLIGTRLSASTTIFMGWFGPRGLASIVLGLVYLEHEAHSQGEPTIRIAVMVTVLLSIFAHGLSAMPGIRLYSRAISRLGPDAPECRDTPELLPSADDAPAPRAQP